MFTINPDFIPASDDSILIKFGDTISENLHLKVFSYTQYSHSLSTNTKLEETCLKTNELSKISLSCFNNDTPLNSVGFYFGCSRMLQYSILTKKDGRLIISQ